MPEGPEIRRAADKIEKVLKEKTIDKVEFGLQSLVAKRYSTILILGARFTPTISCTVYGGS